MVAPCALCKGRNPPRTHVFPQNSRAEVQVKWVKAMGLPQDQEDAVLEEMRQLEQKGNRPRWCTFHFEYDSAGIHFPKYFDPEEGKAAQGWKEEEDDDDQGPSTNSHDGSSSPAEKRRTSRKRTVPPPSPSPSSKPPATELSLKKILAEVGISLPGMEEDEEEREIESQKPSPSRKKAEVATSVEKTLQSILMDAGLPVPETLQAKTGVLVDEDEDEEVPSPSLRRLPSGSAVAAVKKATTTMGQPRRQGTLVPNRGGATLSKPKMLMNPMSNNFAGGEWPKVVIPTPPTPKLPVYCYNHNTMEKYDDSDSLRHFTMPCSSLTKNCQSELTVIMSRARALEDQFDEMSNCVLRLVQLYKTKTPQAYRPPQSLATISGRAAAVAGPVIGRPLYNNREVVAPSDSLAVQERRERRMGSRKKEPERLLTDDDLASTVRRRLIKQEQSSADEEEEEEEDENEEESEDE
ncbi:hypothetical protein PMAYCL1PPCAC_07429, partial [Pristionchus mayeri]